MWPTEFFFLKKIVYSFTCVCTCMSYKYQWIQRPGEGIGPPGTRVTGGCEPVCWFWELNLSSLQSSKHSWAISLAPATPGFNWDFMHGRRLATIFWNIVSSVLGTKWKWLFSPFSNLPVTNSSVGRARVPWTPSIHEWLLTFPVWCRSQLLWDHVYKGCVMPWS